MEAQKPGKAQGAAKTVSGKAQASVRRGSAQEHAGKNKVGAGKDIEIVHISELKPDLKNARSHTPRNLQMIVDALHEVGAARSGVIDESGTILAGNATAEAMAEAGIERVKIVEADGNEWVVVRRRGLTPEQKTRLALFDNRSAELADWDVDILREFKNAELLHDLWTDKEIEELLAETVAVGDGPEAKLDRAEELRQEWDVQPGQVWQIGRHRLLCGDSSEIEALFGADRYDLLLVTDPPYGVSYADKNEFLNAIDRGNRVQSRIAGDHQSPEEMQAFWLDKFSAIRKCAKPGASYYITGPQGGDLLLFLLLALKDSGFPLRHILVWAKNNHVLGRSDYHYQHEPIIYGWVDGAAHRFYGGSGETSLWNIARPVRSELHPTMKPVELFARAIRNSSQAGDLVCDPFLGSGTTMVAAEQLNRVCYGIEIEPGYCAVVIERMKELGLEPKLLGGA